jgi:polysaccharide deacetylase 2 family uncharacterized protein YibQ
MSEVSAEIGGGSGTSALRRKTPLWLKEAGHVALREAVAVAVLALIIMSGVGWFWSDPPDLGRAETHNLPAMAHAAEALPAAFEPGFGRAEPIQLGAIAPSAGRPAPLLRPQPGGVRETAAEAPAWQRFAVAPVPAAGKARIAIIIDDLGLDRRGARDAIALPAPMTLAIMSYAEDTRGLAEAGRAAGHELLLHIPMEPEGGQNPGPHALTAEQSRTEFDKELRWALDRFGGYVGVNNHMGSRVTASAEQMSWLFEELERRGLMFVDSRTTKETVAPVLAAHFGLPFAERDVFLDNEFGAEAVGAQLKALEAEARRNGFAVAIGHPHRGTIAALKAWLPTLAAKGIVIVPISQIAASRDTEAAWSLN